MEQRVLGTSGIVRPFAARRQCTPRSRLRPALAAFLLTAASLGGCGTLGIGGDSDKGTLDTRYLGSLAADDPQAVDIGRRILRGGGTAADAAAAMGLALTVTQPSRAGLDGGGVCLVHGQGMASVEEIDFLPQAIVGAEAQIPGIVRGLSALQARYGVLRWQQSVGLAEQLANGGIAVTQTLLADLATNGLSADGPGGVPLKVGDVLPQNSVAAVLSQLRVAGPNDFYSGRTAGLLIAAGVPAGPLAKWLPTWSTRAGQPAGGSQVFATDGTGGRAAAAAWQALAAQSPADAAAAFSAARSGKADQPAASTAYTVVDADGRAVSCALTMGRIFGTGHLVPDLDIYAAVGADDATRSSLAPAITLAGSELTGVFAGAGGTGAAADVAATAWLVVGREQPLTTALAGAVIGAPDRVNGISCPGGSPSHAGQCVAAQDPRGTGYALTAARLGN